MKKLITISLVLFGAILLAGCSFNMPPVAKQAPATTTVACTKEAKLCPDGSAVGRIGQKCEFESCPAIANDKVSGQLPINIKPNQVISLPFILIGKASNQFEGQWGNVKMYDSQDNLLTTKLISTLCDYGKSCDFSVALDGMPKTSTGYLIFSQDNPSGLPQNEYSYRINIGFKRNN